MTAQILQNPFPTFTGNDGQPLSGGYVYFGSINQDPRQYPVPVYYDQALTLPITQPLRTTAGYLHRNGSPTNVWTNGSCSLMVLDSAQRQVLYEPEWIGVADAAAAAAAATAAPLVEDAQEAAAAAAASQIAAAAAAAAAAASAKLYPDYTTAIAATADGDFFSIYATDLVAKLIYLRVAGQGELKAVSPFLRQQTAEAAHLLASSTTFDAATTLPAGARVDFVAIDSLFGYVNLRNRAFLTTTSQDLNLLGRSRPTDFPAGVLGGIGNPTPTVTLGVAGSDGSLKAVRLQYPGAGTAVYGIVPLMGNITIPPGRWSFAYEAISNSGASGSYRMQNSTSGAYSNVTVAALAWPGTVLTQTFVLTVDTALGSIQMVREAAAPSAFDITIDNVRLVPGSSAGSASASTEHLYRPPGLPVTNGLAVQNNSLTTSGARAVVPLTASTTFTGVTYVTAMRKQAALTLLAMLVTDKNAVSGAFYIRENANYNGIECGLNIVDTDMNYPPLNDYVVLTVTGGPDGSSIYMNSLEVGSSPTPMTAFTTDYFSMHGNAGTNTNNYPGRFVSDLIFGRRLTRAEVLRAVSVMRARITAHGETFTDFGTFYVAEGDSITAGLGATFPSGGYAKLLGRNFTPYLQGTAFAVAGNVLAQLTARAATVDAKIAEAIALSKRVVFSVLVGANEPVATNAAADAYYIQLKAYWTARRATGAKVIASTITGNSGWAAGTIAAMAYLNGLIRGDATQYDGLADYAANVNLGTWNAGNFADAVHPNDTGHTLMETILRPVVSPLVLP